MTNETVTRTTDEIMENLYSQYPGTREEQEAALEKDIHSQLLQLDGELWASGSNQRVFPLY